VDGRDKPYHDGNAVFMGSGLRPLACPGMTRVVPYKVSGVSEGLAHSAIA